MKPLHASVAYINLPSAAIFSAIGFTCAPPPPSGTPQSGKGLRGSDTSVNSYRPSSCMYQWYATPST